MRDVRFTLLLSPEEKQTLVRESTEQGLSLGEWIRQKLFGAQVEPDLARRLQDLENRVARLEQQTSNAH